MLDLVDEARRADEVERTAAVQAHAQQAVEAGKMIHVGVRDKHMADPQELAGGERRDIAEIEQDGAAAEAEIDEQAGVVERTVDQARLNEPAHAQANAASGPLFRRDGPAY